MTITIKNTQGSVIFKSKGANLQGANLQGADLRNADLRNADLRNADLRNANLKEVDLYSSNLEGANLQCADLRGTNLYFTNMKGVYLKQVRLGNHTQLKQANLIGAHMDWDNHCLIALRLINTSDNIMRRMIAGIIMLSVDWCWTKFLSTLDALDGELKETGIEAIKELMEWGTDKSPLPEVLAEPRTLEDLERK